MLSLKEKICQNKAKLIETLVLYFGFVAHGAGLAILGPSLLDLQAKTLSKIDEVTYVIVGRAVGLGLGSMANIFIAKKLKLDTILIFSFIFGSIAEVVLPFNTDVWLMVATKTINGFFMGIVESTSTLYIFHLWKDESAPFLQALLLSFGLGSLITPLYTRCFLVSPHEDGSFQEEGTSVDEDTSHLIPPAPSEIQIHWAFIINASLMFSVAVIVALLKFSKRKEVATDQSIAESSESTQESVQFLPLAAKFNKGFIYFVSMAFIFLYCGIEISIGSYLTPFAVKCQLHMAKKTVALMTSAYWTAYTFARIITIIFVNLIGVFNSLLISLAFVGISNIFIFGYGDKLEWALWTGIVLNGIGLSAIWAALFSYISLFFRCTETLTSLIICAACLGECVMPIITSLFIATNPNMFQWIVLLSSILMILLFAVLAMLLNLYKRITLRAANSVIQVSCESQSDLSPPSYKETMRNVGSSKESN